MNRIKRIPRKWRLTGMAGLILLVSGGLLYRYLCSPERVVHLALSALHRQDAQALVSLASEKERRLLNLTPQTVEACLRETWWRDPRLQPNTTVVRSAPLFANIYSYSIEVVSFAPNRKPRRFSLEVYQDPSGRWRLALSELLYISPRVCNGVEGDHAPVWDALARRIGIRGVAGPDGSTRYNDGTFAPTIYLTHR